MSEQVTEKIHFLLPVDYSEASRQAAVYAIKLAIRLNASVEFLHVYYSPSLDLLEVPNSNFSGNQADPEAIGNIEANEKNIMDGFVNEILTKNGFEIQVSKTVIPGIPEDEIVDYIRAKMPNLVLMGTRGKNVQKVAIFGSVTVSVMDRIKVPLLVIPEHYKTGAQDEADKIAYVTSFDNADFSSIDHLMKLLAPLADIRLNCLHIESAPGNTWDSIKLGGLADYIQKKYKQELVKCSSLSEKNLLPDLDAYIAEHKVNVIAMTAQRKGLISKLFSSDISRKLLYHTTIPLLIFHP
ncbi:MAG: universal stress protein [Bacteroidales bacterium]